MNELKDRINQADWLTIGIMAPTAGLAIKTIRTLETQLELNEMKIESMIPEEAPVYLKANQNTGQIYIREEFGLGIGILISCQLNNEIKKTTQTYGPFPLDFFDR